MKCNHCNADIEPCAQFCPSCGNKVGNTNVDMEKLSFGMKILSFLIPIVGLIYYFMKKSEAPQKAKEALQYALAGIVLTIIFWLGL